MNKITFFVMSEKGYSVLCAFIKLFHAKYIDQVICSKDPKVKQDYYTEIESICIENNIPFTNRKSGFTLKTEYSFAISWQWLIHHDSKIIIIHDSLLPKYRGFAPLVNALVNGEKELGATAILANAEFDRGDIIAQKKIEINYPIKIKNAIETMANVYIEIVKEITTKIINNHTIQQKKQNETEATYSLWRDEDDYKIDWHQSSQKIKRLIDALSDPYKGSSAKLNGSNIRILDAELVNDVVIENRTPGKVIFVQNEYPIIVCGEGLLKITSGYYEETNQSILPLIKFRSRFS